jgi:hypothetical protein
MKCLHHDFDFELPDEWLAEAKMSAFVPLSTSYQVDASSIPNRAISKISVCDVQPVRRQLSHGVFNNDSESGLSARDRVVRILRGFRTGEAIPPVEVAELPMGSNCRYRLTHGAHRLYCSVAVGFTEVPAVKGLDL